MRRCGLMHIGKYRRLASPKLLTHCCPGGILEADGSTSHECNSWSVADWVVEVDEEVNKEVDKEAVCILAVPPMNTAVITDWTPSLLLESDGSRSLHPCLLTIITINNIININTIITIGVMIMFMMT